MADKTLVDISGGRVAYVGNQGHVELDLPDGKVATFSVGISEKGELADECAAEQKAREDREAQEKADADAADAKADETLSTEQAAHDAAGNPPAADLTLGKEEQAFLDTEGGTPAANLAGHGLVTNTEQRFTDTGTGLKTDPDTGQVVNLGLTPATEPLPPDETKTATEALDEAKTDPALQSQTESILAAAEPDVELQPPGDSAVAPTALKGKLPTDFPGYDALTAKGLTTYAQVRNARDPVTDWRSIDGIGKATSDKIATALGE